MMKHINRKDPLYKKGQLVKFKDGDGRPHQIHKVEWDPGLGRPGDGFYEYTFVDNGKALEDSIIPFIDKVLVEDFCDWIDYHICTAYDYNGDLIDMADIGNKIRKDFIKS